jgi:hypothetical protein
MNPIVGSCSRAFSQSSANLIHRDAAAAVRADRTARPRLRAVAAAVAGCLLLSCSAVPGARASTVALGLHYGADDSTSQYEAFGTWLGRKVMYRVVFANRTSWAEISSPWFLNVSRQWVNSDPARIEVITLPLLPTTDAGDFAAIIRGEHDSKFTSFAQRVQSLGIASRVIVRLGWEGNGDWYPWAYASDPSGYRGAFRRAVQRMRAAAPGLRFEWNVSCRASRRGGPAAWTEGYPGDDVVDIISMDVYDEWISSWASMRDGEAGLNEFRNFAISHNKPEAYPEWGCSTNSSAQGGGDNPTFVENMKNWFAGRPGQVLYHGYWNTSAGGPNAAVYASSGSVLVPNAASTYRRLFSFPQGAPTVLSAR